MAVKKYRSVLRMKMNITLKVEERNSHFLGQVRGWIHSVPSSLSTVPGGQAHPLRQSLVHTGVGSAHVPEHGTHSPLLAS